MEATRLEKARERLEKAVSRLEALALEEGPNPTLAEELEALRAENAAMRERSRTVSDRLDSAVDRIKGILES